MLKIPRFLWSDTGSLWTPTNWGALDDRSFQPRGFPQSARPAEKCTRKALLSSRGTDVPSALRAAARDGCQNRTSGKGSSTPTF